MLRLENVANPATAATAVVPDRVPLPGFASSATVTVPVNPVAVFPWASRAVTCTAGVMAAPAAALLGWTVNTRPVAAATVVVPASVPLPGFAPMASVTLPLNPVAVFPWASCATTWTAGVIAAPARALLGWTVNSRVAAVPGVILNAALLPVVTP